ncbi:hypothetical protein JXB41_00570 [Candidatus Woesearchaeota archaeon]|nr:hypothetical protein [Candidatus Woesearchaeota archaeon]
MDKLKKAYFTAIKCLRSRYQEKGIFAGSHHFDDYWARDSFFASLGALELEDYDIVKKNLQLFLDFQRENGQIPLRVGSSTVGIVLKGIGIKTRRKDIPRYFQDKGRNPATDQNSLLLMCFYNYIKKTRDIDFLKQNILKLERCIEWNLKQDNDNDLLMEEKCYATWADNVKKRGKVLYTNICHCHALFCVSELFNIIEGKENKEKYFRLHEKTKKRINEVFWNGHYYMDWIDDHAYNYLSTDGNILSIIWNITDKNKSKKIQESLENFGINRFVPSLTNMPQYPFNKASSMLLRFIWLGDYQNRICWTWLGCLDAVAKFKLNLRKEAQKVLEKIADVIVKDNNVYEVYEQSGRPVKRLFYKSEYNFAWSAGLFVWAYKMLENKK